MFVTVLYNGSIPLLVVLCLAKCFVRLVLLRVVRFLHYCAVYRYFISIRAGLEMRSDLLVLPRECIFIVSLYGSL